MKSAPSLSGFDVKVARARTHHQDFNEANRRLDKDRPYRFEGTVVSGGRIHLYRVVKAPPPDPMWAAILGDCVHNLRAALDYLAQQLVLVSGHTPNQHTEFPVRRHRQPGATPVTIQGGVREDIRQAVESVQPYQGTMLGGRLARLHKLDVIDKHRQLLLVATVAPRAFGWDLDPALQPPATLMRRYVPLHEIAPGVTEPVFKILFPEPVVNLTPNLHPFLQVAFSRDESTVKELDVDQVLAELCATLHDVRALFAPFFP